MKKLFLIANWKSNKIISETESWLHTFYDGLKQEKLILENKEVVICPSFTLFEHARYCSKNLNLPIKFGAQNISPFEEGAYTGEINGRQIKEVADYVIVGHSERRENFYEDSKMLEKKAEMANKFDLMTVFCVQGKNTFIPQGVGIVAYEPVEAIGTGNPDTPENAQEVASFIKGKNEGVTDILYGGSVNSKNVGSFTKMSSIDGVLVGGASLSPLEFIKIIKNA